MIEIVEIGTFMPDFSPGNSRGGPCYIVARLNGGSARAMAWQREIPFFTVFAELVWGLVEDQSRVGREGNYRLNLRCTNCGHKWPVELPKGVRANSKYIDCVNCGCGSFVDAIEGNVQMAW